MSLTNTEEKILSLLPRGEGRRQVSELAVLTGLNTRAVYSIIERLREKGVPIVSTRKGGDTGLLYSGNRRAKEARHSIL